MSSAPCTFCESLVSTVALCNMHLCFTCCRSYLPTFVSYVSALKRRLKKSAWLVSVHAPRTVHDTARSIDLTQSSLAVVRCSKQGIVLHTYIDRTAFLAIVTRLRGEAYMSVNASKRRRKRSHAARTKQRA